MTPGGQPACKKSHELQELSGEAVKAVKGQEACQQHTYVHWLPRATQESLEGYASEHTYNTRVGFTHSARKSEVCA